jgi:hypothetical protein
MSDKIKAIIEQNHFIQTLPHMHGGATASDLASKLKELVAAVGQTGKKGSLKLKIALKPAGGGKVELSAEVSGEIPKPSQQASIFFTTEKNELTRIDPEQREIQFPTGEPAKPAASQ